VGGIRRIIVPVELGYPDNDFNKLGPKPTTFSGAWLQHELGARGAGRWARMLGGRAALQEHYWAHSLPMSLPGQLQYQGSL